MLIRKTLIFLCAVLCVSVLSAQDFYEGGVGYTITSNTTVSVTGYDADALPGNLVIPSTVTNNGTTYTVTFIQGGAFYFCRKITSVKIPNTVTAIGTIDDGTGAFETCYYLTSIEIPSSVTTIGKWAFFSSSNLISITCLAETAPAIGTFAFPYSDNKTLTVPFGSDYSSWENATDWVQVNYKINAGDTNTLNNTFLITTANKRKVINNGVLRIAQGGEIINTTSTNVGGEIEIVSPSVNQGNWQLFGAPFEDYKLEVVIPEGDSDVAVSKYDYTSGSWSNDWATVETPMSKGEGAFAYHFYTGPVVFTTKGETANYQLNNSDVSVTHSLVNSSDGYWMALSNPYPAKLSVSKFLQNQTNVQGQCVSAWNGTYFDLTTEIGVAEGFFVNYGSSGSHTANFNKTQLSNYPTNAKSEITPREFIELALEKGHQSVKVYFAQNEDAEQEYDIYDANKMFATTGVAEPYLLTDGVALIKEEVKTLPYYATMNVRSEDDTVMNFVLKNLPDGYMVSIIDGEEVIDMAEGSVYSTEILKGDNENRFKLLVKQGVGLADVEELDVRIINNNRHVTVQILENNLTIEVYNTLGQKVYETKERNFVLNGASAGVYMIKAFNNLGSKTSKIVIK